MSEAVSDLVPCLPGAPLVLWPDLSIAAAASNRELLLQALQDHDGDLALDLGQVSDFDSSGVQLLLSARLSLRQRGQALQLVAASPAVRDALATFGLTDLISAPRAD